MPSAKPPLALVSILAADRVGLVSAIAGRLYDLGINLRDTTFAAMGQGAEFSAVCELPGDLGTAELERELSALPELAEARVEVTDYEYEATPGPGTLVTHIIELSGGDQLGLIARLAEVFREYGANIVRLEAQTVPGSGGDRYMTRFGVAIPPARAEICLSAVANTAGSLRLDCSVEEA
ncbi:ACT domain-containing protein [Skermanella rosea]|uniref:glycine cleavage system protein R n=1 Tax=Skermanella rosea TaxID=1817965 RepID=UPI001931E28B|nr:ACT domain-containing protein [Skermanella rosea]UEM05947.1 ACT domain-containing protein [Skermanella rosea]